jgi:hypothetical protein
LLELADEQFSELQSTQEQARRDIRERLDAMDYAVSLDISSLAEYLRNSSRVSSVRRRLSQTDLNARGEERREAERMQDQRDLLTTLKHYGFSTVQNLDDFLGMHPSRFGRLAAAYRQAFGEPSQTSFENVLEAFILIDRRADESFGARIYDSADWDRIKQGVIRFHGTVDE